ncbi:MAG: ABC transporter transmembrane domain-containing protein [Geodermatophilaceae bacterium]
MNNTFEQKVIFDLRSDLYSHIQMLPLRWFDNRATGDLMTRILEDVNSVERMLIDGVEQGVVAVLQVVIVLGMMFYVSASLTLVGLAPAPFLAGGALWYTLTAHRRYRLQRRASSAMNSLLHDNLAGIRQIKSFVREREEHSRFNKVSDQLRHATLVVMTVWAIYHPSMIRHRIARHRARRSGSARVQVLGGAMQVGDLIAFLMLTGFLYEPINKLHQLNQLVQAGRAAGERVFEIIDEPIEPGWNAGRCFDRDASARTMCVTTTSDSATPRRRSRAAAHQLSRAARRDDRARRHDGRRQIDPRQSAHPFLRVRQR